MPLRGVERGQLFLRGRFLVLLLPLLERLTVDPLARFLATDRRACGLGGFLIPVGQTVAAETGEDHQIDVLHVRSFAQMRQQAAERSGFQFNGIGDGVHALHLPRR